MSDLSKPLKMLINGGHVSEGREEGVSYFTKEFANRCDFVQYLCFMRDKSFIYESIIKRVKKNLLFLVVV